MNSAYHQITGSPGRKWASFWLCNIVLFAAFSLLPVLEDHLHWAGVIDDIVAPWAWLAGFFIVSYCYLRGRVAWPVVLSACLAIMFSGLLLFFGATVMAPIFDPCY